MRQARTALRGSGERRGRDGLRDLTLADDHRRGLDDVLHGRHRLLAYSNFDRAAGPGGGPRGALGPSGTLDGRLVLQPRNAFCSCSFCSASD